MHGQRVLKCIGANPTFLVLVAVLQMLWFCINLIVEEYCWCTEGAIIDHLGGGIPPSLSPPFIIIIIIIVIIKGIVPRIIS
jgi:hypothetical protein